jgi:hypothetical protein
MKLADALDRVQKCAEQMNARYGKTVFDEWALVSLRRGQEKIVSYDGPRRDDFQKNFVSDLGSMRAELLTAKHEPGHYDFARHGVGTGFEAFVCVGDELYLICNNTQRSMDDIAREQRWLEAQKAFAELTEHFHGNAVSA